MTTERIEVVITERGAKTVERSINSIGGAAKKAEGATRLLHQALGLLGGMALVNQVVQMADTYTNLQNRLRLVTGPGAPTKEPPRSTAGWLSRRRSSALPRPS